MNKWIIVAYFLLNGINLDAQNTFPSSGNVGIGTTSPGNKLTVLGSIHSSGTVGGNGGFYNVLQITPLGDAPAYFYFDTNIPATDQFAPQLHINGYTYGASNRALKVTLGWYYYAGNFYWTQYHSDLGYRKPSRIRVGKYTKNGSQYIRVEIANDGIYWSNYNISAVDVGGSITHYEGWTWAQGEMPVSTTSQITVVERSIDVQIDGRLDLIHATTDNVPGAVLSSYPLASFINKGSGNGYRGLQIGAPTGDILSPVYLKVTGTSNRFSILNESDQENFTILSNGNTGIGTSSPSEKLAVSGNAIFAGSILASASGSRPIQLSNGMIYSNGDNGGWAFGYHAKGSAGTDRGGFGFYGSGNGLDYYYVGDSYANPTITTYPDNGNVGIGTRFPSDKLSVNGNIRAKKLIVSQTGWPDYVFDPAYKLKPLSELSAFIQKHQHLPDMPSAKEVEEKGISVGDNQALLLKKIEELTLYIIKINKEHLQSLNSIEQLQKRITELEKNKK
ncbi:hypothetical protein [Sediminibacterium sp.]|uniref:hypothetical protein n=1 Tax=Sediminibacterium sp. TaxID=1917865 RepID=UPI0025F16D45|nr:hypothetical protein [Sediminibacterium sp.]MBW0177574.1 hypothetical protein [Sediminibacterium sp.]